MPGGRLHDLCILCEHDFLGTLLHHADLIFSITMCHWQQAGKHALCRACWAIAACNVVQSNGRVGAAQIHCAVLWQYWHGAGCKLSMSCSQAVEHSSLQGSGFRIRGWHPVPDRCPGPDMASDQGQWHRWTTWSLQVSLFLNLPLVTSAEIN